MDLQQHTDSAAVASRDAIGIFACDQQPIVVEGLARIFAGSPEFRYLGCAATLEETMEYVRRAQPEVVLIDQSEDLRSILQFLGEVRAAQVNGARSCQAVVWGRGLGEGDSLRALQAGARGIVRRNAPVETLLECLRAVSRGEIWLERSAEDTSRAHGRGNGLHTVHNGPYGNALNSGRGLPRLTKREKEILEQVCAGLKNKEIAEALAITAGTVKVHLMHIFEKTGVKDRFELAVQGRRLLGRARTNEDGALSPFGEHVGQAY